MKSADLRDEECHPPRARCSFPWKKPRIRREESNESGVDAISRRLYRRENERELERGLTSGISMKYLCGNNMK